QITPPRPMKVFDPWKDLRQLFQDLVEESPRARRGLNLKSDLREKFTTAGVVAKIKTNIGVEVPIFEKRIKIPYGFQSGRFNLIQTARFRMTDPAQAQRTACQYAVEGKSLYETTDPQLGPLQLILVGEFRSQSLKTRF